MKRPWASVLACLSFALISQACCSGASRSQAQLCDEARASLLPAQPRHVRNDRRVIEARYSATELPRGDGRNALVMTDIDATVDLGSGPEHIRRDVAYFEDREKCWPDETMGNFFCYQVALPKGNNPYAVVIQVGRTRAFLSVLAFLATGGKADTAAAEIAARKTASVDFDQLLEQTSGPSSIGTWYYCQSCGGEKVALGGPVSLQGIRFGRGRHAIYFVTQSGWVARLSDDSVKASYAFCGAPRKDPE